MTPDRLPMPGRVPRSARTRVRPTRRALGALIRRDLGDTVRNLLALPLGATFTVGLGLWCAWTVETYWEEGRVFSLTFIASITVLWSTTVTCLNTVLQERERGCCRTLIQAGVAPLGIAGAKLVCALVFTFALLVVGGLAIRLGVVGSLALGLGMTLGSVPFVLLGLATGLVVKNAEASYGPVLALTLSSQATALATIWPRIASWAWLVPLGAPEALAAHLAYGAPLPASPAALAVSWLAWLAISIGAFAWASRRFAREVEGVA